MRYWLISGLVLLLTGCGTAPPPIVIETPSTPNMSLASIMVNSHNQVRARFDLPPVVWSSTLAHYAQSWANYLVQTECQMLHRVEAGNNPLGVGENLFWSSANMWTDGTRDRAKISAAEVVSDWASEVQYYDYNSNTCATGKQCGHYTQIVWRPTKRIGCGMAYCPSGEQIWVCNYDPAGNVLGYRPY